MWTPLIFHNSPLNNPFIVLFVYMIPQAMIKDQEHGIMDL
jgi:hypothetical protein